MADYLVTETQITACAWLVKATSEEDARKVWEGSGPDVQLVDQQVTDSQGLTITEGAGGYRWPAPADTAHAAAPSNWRDVMSALIPYAESRAEDLSDLKESGDEDPQFPGSDEAWQAVEAARAMLSATPTPASPPSVADVTLEALRLAAERIEMNNYGGEEDEALVIIRAAIAAAQGKEG